MARDFFRRKKSVAVNQFPPIVTPPSSSGPSGTQKAALALETFNPPVVPLDIYQRYELEAQFQAQWQEIADEAKALVQTNIEHIPGMNTSSEIRLRNTALISYGRLGCVLANRPRPVRLVAKEILAQKFDAIEIMVADMASMLEWINGASSALGNVDDKGKNPTKMEHDPRGRLLKRRQALEAALPTEFEALSSEAFMHVEHEILKKKFHNDETMLGDSIADIPRFRFLSTEDGYAWDMLELSQAITANGGVMRNPLSKNLFSPEDVKHILAHPLGKKLRPMLLSQAQMKKGVRPETINHIKNLGHALVEDKNEDAAASRKAVDEFLVYVATLPQEEQKVLNELKIPGRDSHTRMAFDYTVGESVRDAKANKTCFHKVGDFLIQAVAWLEISQET